jgi:hypothetical protein
MKFGGKQSEAEPVSSFAREMCSASSPSLLAETHLFQDPLGRRVAVDYIGFDPV